MGADAGVAPLPPWRCGALSDIAAPALQDFDGRCCPGIAVLRALAAPLLPRRPPPRRCGALAPLLPRRPGVADVGGSDADRGEAEPFTAKRSGTG